MTDTQLTIIVASIAPTLAAVGALIVSVVNALRSAARETKQESAIKEVHTIVNDRSTVQVSKIESLERQVRELVADRAEKKQESALLAQSAASNTVEKAKPAEVVVVNDPHDPVPTIVKKP